MHLISYLNQKNMMFIFSLLHHGITQLLGQDPSKYDVSKLKQSFDDFSVIVNKFPGTEYAKDSRNRLIYLKNKMAANELYIAKYYVKRSAHVAAIERIKYLLTNYSGTPSTEEGLLILIKSYNYLKMHDLASDAARVLKENYPNYVVANKNGITTATKKKIKVVKRIDSQKDDGESWFDFLNIYNYF